MSLPGNINQLLIGAAASGGGDEAYEIQRSLRFNSADSAYLNRTPSSASNRRTWTWSGWVKRGELGSYLALFGNQNYDVIQFRGTTDNEIDIFFNGTSDGRLVTNRSFRDASAWYHIVVSCDTTQTTASDRLKLYVNGVQETSFSTSSYPAQDYQTSFNAATPQFVGATRQSSVFRHFQGYLAETNFVDGQALAASDFGEYDTNNVWRPKEFTGTYDRGANQSQVWSTATTVSFYGSTSNGNTSTIADVFDGSETTGYYVLDSSATGPGLCYKLTFPSGVRGSRVRFRTGGDAGAAAALNTEVVGDLVGGSAYTWYTIYEGAETDIDYIVFGNNDSGGTRNNITNAIEIDGKLLVDSSVSLTDNSFYLNFSNNNSTTALGLDSSGNNNDFTVNNFSVSPGSGNDSLIDTPTNYTAGSGNNGGNYCTFNPLHPVTSSSAFTNGNLEVTVYGGNDRGRQVLSTLNPGSGKYYFEITPTSINTTYIGLFLPVSVSSIGDARVAGYRSDGLVFKDGTNLGAVASTYAADDVIGVAYDIEGAEVKFYKNGTLEYTVSGITNSLVNVSPGISCDSSGATNFTTGVANFGQRSFAHTPPTDHLSICTKNLATPTISDGSTGFEVALYTGNSTARSITGLNMAPDLVWIKKRSSGTGNHSLADTVRGATKNLVPNDSQSEGTEPTYVTAFNSDGFSLGASSIINNNGDTYVSWNWNAGDSNTTISAGSLNSSFYDQSAVWSDNTTASTSFDSGTLPQAFDGNLTTGPLMTGQTTTYVVDLSSDFTDGTIQVYTAGYQKIDITDDGGTNREIFDGSESGYDWYPATPATFTNIQSVTVKPQGSGSGNSNELRAIKVNGKILVDSDQTPTDIPAATSTVRANPTTGFSIVSYTGTGSNGTIGHGLNAAPEFIVIKDRDNSVNWGAGHNSATWEKYFHLNLNLQQQDSALVWQDTTPTSSLFSVGTSALVNGSSNAYIAYCFAPVQGYSAFGSYTGNALSDGPFVYTGFRPAFLLIKIYDGDNSNWLLLDSARDTYNVVENNLYADENSAENQFDWVDFLSNGFKVKNASLTQINGNGYGYMYAAFAENPFQANGGIAR